MSTPSKREVAEKAIENMPVGKWVSLENLAKNAQCGRLYSVSKLAMARFLLEQKDRIQRKVRNRVSFYRRIEK